MSMDSRWDSRFRSETAPSSPEIAATDLVLHSSCTDAQRDDSSNASNARKNFFIGKILAASSRLPFISPILMERDAPLGKGSSFLVTRDVLYLPHSEPCFVAVKHILTRERSPQQLRQTYKSVMREIGLLTHKSLQGYSCIMKALGYGWKDGLSESHDPYLVVEYSEYGTLSEYLDNKGLRLLEGRDFALDVAIGLKALHDHKIIHGDVKPQNVLIFPSDDDETGDRALIAKLADFGNSLSEKDIVQDGMRPLGTVKYNAPEIQLKTKDLVTVAATNLETLQRADIYSFGLLLWEVFCAGSTYVQRHWLEPDEDDLDFLQRLLDTQQDGLLSKALDYLGKRRSTYSKKTVHILTIVENTLKLCLRDDPLQRSGIASIVGSLSEGASDKRSQITYSTRKNLVPTAQASQNHGVVATSVYAKKQAWLELPPENESTTLQSGPITLRRIAMTAASSSKISIVTRTRRTQILSQPQHYSDKDIDIFKACLNILPPWEVQVAVFDELMEDSKKTTDKVKQADACLQISACYYVGYGIRINEEEALTWLIRASPNCETAAALLGRVREALNIVTLTTPDHEEPKRLSVDAAAVADSNSNQVYFSIRFREYQQRSAVQLRNFVCTGENVSEITNILPSTTKDVITCLQHSDCFRDLLKEPSASFESILEVKAWAQEEISKCLILACQYGQFDAATMLASHCNIFTATDGQPSPLHWLISFEPKQANALAQILVKGSNPTEANSGICAHLLNANVASSISFPEHSMDLFGTPLHWAVRVGNLDLVQILIALGADLNLRWLDQSDFYDMEALRPHEPSVSPLDLAAIYHYSEVADYLISCGAATYGGALMKEHTPFHVVGHATHPFARLIIHGRHYRAAVDSVVDTLKKHGLDINRQVTDYRITPLRWALQHGPSEDYIVDSLLRSGATSPGEIEDGSNLVSMMIRAYRSPFITWKLRRAIDLVADLNRLDDSGMNALHYCATLGNVEKAEVLTLSGRVDIDARSGTKDKQTPLMFAATYDKAEMICWLLGQGAVADLLSDRGDTALRMATVHRRTNAIKALIDGRASIIFKQPTDSGGLTTVLHNAVRHRNEVSTSIMRAVLDQNPSLKTPAMLNYQDTPMKWTSLHYAAYRGDVDAVDALLTAGADRHISNCPGMTDMRWATSTLGTPLQVAQKSVIGVDRGNITFKTRFQKTDFRDRLEEIVTILSQE